MLVDFRSKLLEPGDFGGNVIRLDVEMNPALVVDTLDLDADLIRPVFKHDVVAARTRMIGIDRASQSLRPELRCLLDVVDVAVDQYAVDARAVPVIPTRSFRAV